jgi:hypothetical protein
MRLWSIHPRYLDQKGLTALWREGLLAQKVLSGETRGYRRHPQLERFRDSGDPLSSISGYLSAVCREAERRGFSFRREKICSRSAAKSMEVTRGQLSFELDHLRSKLIRRDPAKHRELSGVLEPEPNPVFSVREGPVEPWERFKPGNH